MIQEKPRIFFRVDANSRTGSGHLMRCLAFAHGWQIRGGKSTFISRCPCEVLRSRILEAGFDFLPIEYSYPDPADLQNTLAALKQGLNHSSCATMPWLILDGYHFDDVYQHRVRKDGNKLFVIDDNAHLSCYHADILLNQNVHAEGLTYRCNPDILLLLGTRHVLLREEFNRWRNWIRPVHTIARRVLVTLGGSDPDNVTPKVIQVLQQIDLRNLEVRIVVGPANPHLETLQDAISGCKKFKILSDVRDMSKVMVWADIAISAGGSTCWELAFMGVPNIILVLAANQEQIARELHRAGASVNMGWFGEVSSEALQKTTVSLLQGVRIREEMSRRGRSLVDGLGVKRAIDLLWSLLIPTSDGSPYAHSSLR